VATVLAAGCGDSGPSTPTAPTVLPAPTAQALVVDAEPSVAASPSLAVADGEIVPSTSTSSDPHCAISGDPGDPYPLRTWLSHDRIGDQESRKFYRLDGYARVGARWSNPNQCELSRDDVRVDLRIRDVPRRMDVIARDPGCIGVSQPYGHLQNIVPRCEQDAERNARKWVRGAPLDGDELWFNVRWNGRRPVSEPKRHDLTVVVRIRIRGQPNVKRSYPLAVYVCPGHRHVRGTMCG